MRELVDRSIQGDAEAFGSLYDLLCNDVYRYFFYQVRRAEDAEDLVSQTFIRVWRSISGFKWRDKPFEAWLFTVARSQLMDFYRQKRGPEAELDELCPDGTPGPEAQAIANLDATATREALTRLTDEQHEVLVLKFYLNRDNHEIAKTMGKREGTVRALQMRALRALKRELGDD